MSKSQWELWMCCVRCQSTRGLSNLCFGCTSRKALFEQGMTVGPPTKSSLMEDVENFITAGNYPRARELDDLPSDLEAKRVIVLAQGSVVYAFARASVLLDKVPTKEEAFEVFRIGNPLVYYSAVEGLVGEKEALAEKVGLLDSYLQGALSKTDLLGLGVSLHAGLPEVQPLVPKSAGESKSRFDREELDV